MKEKDDAFIKLSLLVEKGLRESIDSLTAHDLFERLLDEIEPAIKDPKKRKTILLMAAILAERANFFEHVAGGYKTRYEEMCKEANKTPESPFYCCKHHTCLCNDKESDDEAKTP